jgi:hypothetical protein
LLYRIRQQNTGHPFKIVIEGTGFPTHNNYDAIVQPSFRVIHDNNEMLNKDYVPVIVLENQEGVVTTTSPPSFVPPTHIRLRLRGYIHRQLAKGTWYWRLLIRIHLRFPQIFRLARTLIVKSVSMFHKSLAQDLSRDQLDVSPGNFLDILKHSSFPFAYNYADIQDFFDDNLPEGKNLTQFEEFLTKIESVDHL